MVLLWCPQIHSSNRLGKIKTIVCLPHSPLLQVFLLFYYQTTNIVCTIFLLFQNGTLNLKIPATTCSVFNHLFSVALVIPFSRIPRPAGNGVECVVTFIIIWMTHIILNGIVLSHRKMSDLESEKKFCNLQNVS